MWFLNRSYPLKGLLLKTLSMHIFNKKYKRSEESRIFLHFILLYFVYIFWMYLFSFVVIFQYFKHENSFSQVSNEKKHECFLWCPQYEDTKKKHLVYLQATECINKGYNFYYMTSQSYKNQGGELEKLQRQTSVIRLIYQSEQSA